MLVSSTLAFVLCHADGEVLAASLTISIAMSIAITAYTITCKTDFTMWGGFFFAFMGVVAAFGVLAIIYPFHISSSLISGLLSLLYSVYLLYDTQLIVGNHGRAYQIDDYIIASVVLYWDFLHLSFEVLKIVSQLQHNSP